MSGNYSILLQVNGVTQLLTTATRIIIDSTTLIDIAFYDHFNPDCRILDGGSAAHRATFVKLPCSCKNYDDTGTPKKSIFNEIATQAYLELLSNELKMPNLYDEFDERFQLLLESIQNSIELCSYLKQCKMKEVNKLGSIIKFKKLSARKSNYCSAFEKH